MTLNIEPNNSNNTGFFNDVKKTCTSLFDQLQEVFNKIPSLIEEKIAGLGSTHQVTASALTEDELKLKASFEQAKAYVTEYGGGEIKDFEKYGITDQNMLFELAKIIAAKDGSGAIFLILNGITDQNMLFELAKIDAAKDSWETSANIQHYGITNQNMLFEIAKIAATQNGLETSRHIQNYGLSNNQQIEILQHVFALAFQNTLKTKNFSQLYDLINIPSAFETPEEQERVKQTLKIAFVNLKNLAIESGVSNKTLALIEDTIFNKHTSLQQQLKDLRWLFELVANHISNPTQNAINQSPLCDESMGPLLNSIVSTIDPTLRTEATRALIEGYNHPEKRTSLTTLMGELKEERFHLIILFGTMTGISPSMTKKICAELPKTKYKDAKLMAPINEIMCAIYKSSTLHQKEQLLGMIFAAPKKGDREPKHVFDKRLAEYRNSQRNWIAAMHSLLFFDQEPLLNQVTNTAELVNTWQTFMGKTFYLKNEFLDQFFPTFGYSKRYPNALIIYATRLQTLSQEKKDQLMPLLGKFANSVLDETFPQIRYDLTESIHLKSLFSENPELLKKWQTALPIETQDSSLSFTIEDTDAWEDLVLMGTEVNNSCQDILDDPRINQCLLTAFLDGKIRLMIAREKETGKIIGRVILRVLQDDNGKPALFVDKLYTRNGVNSEQIRQNILEGCKQKAQNMGIALAASIGDHSDLTTDTYPGALKSLSGPAPYEYVDALSNPQENGTYSIPESYVLWQPSL